MVNFVFGYCINSILKIPTIKNDGDLTNNKPQKNNTNSRILETLCFKKFISYYF